jgi:hypothetical protein
VEDASDGQLVGSMAVAARAAAVADLAGAVAAVEVWAEHGMLAGAYTRPLFKLNLSRL